MKNEKGNAADRWREANTPVHEGRDAAAIINRRRRQETRGTGEIADWASADGNLIVAAISAVSSTGGALRFGYTRDKGSYAIGILGDGEPYTEYVRPTENLDEYLRGLIRDFGKVGE